MLKLRMAAKVSLTSKHTLLDRGVFRELKDIHYFNRVGILFGTVTWPNEQDIAPETLLAEMLPPARRPELLTSSVIKHSNISLLV